MATKIFVITVYPKKLQLAQVRLGKRPQLTDFGEAEWNDKTLDEVVGSIKKDFRVDRVRLLLSPGLDFVVKLEVLKAKPGLREAVAAVLAKKEPVMLEAGDWDFRVTGEKSGFLAVTAFAPEKTVWEKLKGALAKAKITVEAVEPEVLARQRDEVAEIGLALKTDLTGWDPQTLNVVPTEVVKEKSKEEEMKGTASSSRPWVWGILGVILVWGVVIGGVIVSERALESRPTPAPKVTGEVVSGATESAALELLVEASPAATPETEIDLAEYSVQVLNGSRVSGAASKVGLLLEAAGFAEIAVGNANANTYELTSVQRKETVPDEAVEAIVDKLSESYEVEEMEDFLEAEAMYDVVVMVGKET